MTKQEQETIITELETQFNTLASEKPSQEKGVAFNRYLHTWPNDLLQEYVTDYGVGLWVDGVLVTTVTRVKQWQAFKSVARLLRDQPVKTYWGECSECDRQTLVSTASGLCEACTLNAQIGDNGQWEFKPIA